MDLIAQMAAQQDPSTGMYGDTLFEHAYAVLALHNAGAAIPQSAVSVLTSQFTDDGAWALFGGTTPGTADTNTTALVMQALVAVGRPGRRCRRVALSPAYAECGWRIPLPEALGLGHGE